jgi:lysophospholipase L1-like esterase
MAVLPSPQSIHKFYQADGVTPAAGYKVFTYYAGTSTPIATSSDAAGVSANTNPITLNSNGEASIYIPTDVMIDIVLKTPDGLTPVGGTRRVIAGDQGSGIVSIVGFNGVDDGATDNTVAFAAAKSAIDGAGRVYFPKVDTGAYYFATAPDVSGVIIDADEGVSFTGAFPLSSAVRTRRDVPVVVTASNYTYRLTPEYSKPWAESTLHMTDGDIDATEVTAISIASLSHEKQVWVSDAWSSATGEYSTGSDSVSWNTISADTFARVSSTTVSAGDEVMVAFPTSGSYRRICVIRTTKATYYVTADGGGGQPLFGNKPIGGSAAYNNFDYNGRSNHASYYPENSVWSVRVYDRNRFGVFFNGVEVTGIQSTLGAIVRVGFGVQSLSGSLTAAVVGWTRFRRKPLGGKQGITVLCIGDSMTADIHAGWPYAMREALDMSFGIRVNSVANQAVSGENVATQLATLVSNGTGGASHAFVCLGTNDIQFSTNTATFLTNLGTMIDTLTAAFCAPIVWIPPLWYLQSNSGGGGQATQNYEIGAEKRARIARLCADKGVKCVDMMQVTGAVLGGYLIAGNGLDPFVRDNIHPTSYGYRVIGYRLAQALAGAYTRKPSARMAITSFESGDLQNSWTNAGAASYEISESGVVTLSGYLTPGTLTDGTTVLLLPEHIRPAFTAGRFIVSKGGASAALAQVNSDGTIQIYGGSGASYLALDGIIFQTQPA